MATDRVPLKVFLCHASQDKAFVRKLYGDLESIGMAPWLDEKKLLPGQDWNIEILKAIRDSDALIVCLSNQSVTKTGYVQKEIKFALDFADEQPEDAIFLIPARIEECDLPHRLSRFHAADAYDDAGYKLLIESLRTRALQLGREMQPEGAETQTALDILEPRLALTDYYRDAFANLFWERYPELRLKAKREFTVSRVSAGAPGKTALAFALTGHQFQLPRQAEKRPYMYRLLFRKGIHITDHSSYRWDETLNYLQSTTDLVFFVTSPDRSFRKIESDLARTLQSLTDTPIATIANKIDTLKPSEITPYLDEVSQITQRIALPTSMMEARYVGLVIKFILKARQMYM